MRDVRVKSCPRCGGCGVVSDVTSLDPAWLASDWERFASICGLCNGSGYHHRHDGARPADAATGVAA